jgi:hypothetical protein
MQLLKYSGVVNCRSQCVAFHGFTQPHRCSRWWRLRQTNCCVRRGLNAAAFSSGAPRRNHIKGTRHLAGSIRDAGCAGPRESVCADQCRYGFGGPWQENSSRNSRDGVSQQNDWPDGEKYDHSKGKQLTRIIRLCSIRIPIAEKTGSAQAHRVWSFVVHTKLDILRMLAFDRKGDAAVTLNRNPQDGLSWISMYAGSPTIEQMDIGDQRPPLQFCC